MQKTTLVIRTSSKRCAIQLVPAIQTISRSKYALRQHLWKRQIEMAVVMTCYNEDEVLFDNTMTSVVKNIQHLQSRSKSKTWGKDAWKKVLVVIVADGRAKIHPKMLKMLGLMGVYQEGIAKNEVAGRDVQAHIFEYSTQVVVDSMGNVSGGIAPVQICFILKEQNKKKLNSHRWFFNAVCQQLNPNVCILLDVGTKPSGTSIYKLWKDFDKHSNIGGACGEIVVDPGRGCSNILNPLVAAQNFEYNGKYLGQTDRECFWLHLCLAWCFLCLPMESSSESLKRQRSASILLSWREDARGRSHWWICFRCQHVSG